jgi:hypothetical protein
MADRARRTQNNSQSEQWQRRDNAFFHAALAKQSIKFEKRFFSSSANRNEKVAARLQLFYSNHARAQWVAARAPLALISLLKSSTLLHNSDHV